jgi:hypothetical protein
VHDDFRRLLILYMNKILSNKICWLVIKILGKLRFLLVIIYRERVCTQRRQPNTMNNIVTFRSLIFSVFFGALS